MWPPRFCFRSLVGKREGQKDTGRLDRVGMYKVEMDLEEFGWMGRRGLDPTGSGQGPWWAVVYTGMNFRVP